ncbi:MAG: transcriptional regulator [Betaproteobacteria bacterium RIFCSPLOWO2_02_FULL_66_14]|nr:MAG: transcriptional regulator [Betaproteobacteria bacterium RIFCSPLOWO2_02_FULL_66_14]
MPELSRFFGIIIAMYYNDHLPPHFHAKYVGEQASIRIDNGEILEGGLGPRALRLVNEWRVLHSAELLDDWARAQARQPLNKIEPLE